MIENNPLIKVLVPHISCVVYQQLIEVEVDPVDEAVAAGYAEIYIMTPSGIVKHHKLRGTSRYVRTKVETIPGVKINPVKEEISFLPNGKISYTLLQQVESFFKKVIQAKGTAVEAMIWILWNEAQGYHLFVPNQTVSKASARYDWDGVPQGSSIIVDIHSHADFNAFFSGTDNNDDSNGIRYSGVIGHNDKPVRSYAWRFNYREKKYEVKMDDLFEVPAAPELETPEEWMSKVNTYSAPVGGARGYPGYSSIGYPKTYESFESHRSGSGASNKAYSNADWWKSGQTSSVPARSWPSYQPGSDSQVDNEPEEESFLQEFRRKTGSGSEVQVNKKRRGRPSKGETSSKKAEGFSAVAEEPQFADPYSFDNVSDLHWSSGELFGHDIYTNQEKDLDREYTVRGEYVGQEDLVGEDPVIEEMSDLVITAIATAQANPRFDEIACNKGLEAATGFCVINEFMPSVDGEDDLVEELVKDMAMMMNDDKRGNIVKQLFHSLSAKEQSRIATNGM